MAKDIMTIAKRNQAFLLLDRDGVINEERSNYVLNWEQFVFKKDFLENVYLCSEFFDKIFIVTNQSCVGRGLLSVAKLNFIHKKLPPYRATKKPITNIEPQIWFCITPSFISITIHGKMNKRGSR